MSHADKARETRKARKVELDAILDAAPTPDSEVRASELIAEIKGLDARISDLDVIEARAEASHEAAVVTDSLVVEERAAYDKVGRVVKEERTYTAHKATSGDASFFSDAFRADKLGDVQARGRIERHMTEARVEGEGTAPREARAVASSGFAGLVVPQYLVDQAALVLRNGRPTANICTSLPLPDQGMSFLLPRGTTGVSAAVQATENTSVSSTDEVWTNVTLPVATIAGQQIVSRQSLERGTPGLDQLIYLDIAGAYAAALDIQVLNGSGASGQVLGILQTSSINTATLFGAAATATTFYSKLAGQIAAIAGAGTAISPKFIVMHPRRWGWLTLQVDTAGRPLVVPTVDGAFNAYGLNSIPGGYGQDSINGAGSTFRVVGYLHGLPVVTDANIPTNVGGGSTEDVVLVLDTTQMLLFENGDGAPQFMQFDATNVTSLGVTIVGYNYAAFTAGRYPAAVGKVGGADATGANGLQAPTY